MFMLMKQSDKHVQTVNFFSFLKNSIVENGEVVSGKWKKWKVDVVSGKW
jgi:hypothetical protein